MKKIFLCHSSTDKEYVRKVAAQLKRGRIFFDEYSFNTGDDFHTAIQKGLETSALFVFFASRKSLDSYWCNVEINKAKKLEIIGGIKKYITFIIDQSISIEDLPEWMKKNTKVGIMPSPKTAIRDIQDRFNEVYSDFQKLYVGRDDISDNLSRSIGSSNSNLLILSGLDGIGRRTFLTKKCLELFNLHLGPYILLNEASDIDDFYLKLLDEAAELPSPEEIAELVKDFTAKNLDEKSEMLNDLLCQLCKDGYVPCIVDEGALLDDDGDYKQIYSHVLTRFADSNEDNYVAVLHRRKPRLRDVGFAARSYYEYVKPLRKEYSALLLQQLLKNSAIEIKRESLNEIVDYLDGYPPAIYFAFDFVRLYGGDALAADKVLLSDFKVKKFSGFLDRILLEEKEQLLLRYLAAEESVPLSVISIAIDEQETLTAQVLRRLIDLSLVVCIDENYAISRPIRDALTRKYGLLDMNFFDKVQANLISRFFKGDLKNLPLNIVDATIHAVSRSTDSAEGMRRLGNIVRPSSLIKYAIENYHQKEWNRAIAYASMAEKLLPDNIDVKIVLLKAYSQLERWTIAKGKLDEISAISPRRGFYFEGFMLKRQRKFSEACSAFNSAILAGDRGLSVLRDYADCLYRCNKAEEAFEYVNKAYKIDPENVYVLDLIARVSIDTKKWEEAKKFIAELERFDLRGAFVHHRKARLLVENNEYEKALVEIDLAIAVGGVPFETFSQKAKILIELGRLDEAAKVLEEIRSKFQQIKLNIQNGLQCELMLKKGMWKEAFGLYALLSDANMEYRRSIIAGIMQVAGKNSGTADATIKKIELEASRVAAESAKADFAGIPVMKIEVEDDPQEIVDVED